jgi:nucleotide-binding universal stress UspA family protein
MKPYTKILVPTDFSEHAKDALDAAIDLSVRYGAALALIHVYDRVPYPFPDTIDEAIRSRIARAEDESNKALEKQRQLAVERGVQRVEVALLHGYPPAEIVDYATNAGIDLIVMGTHGRRGVSRFLIGSAAERVVRTAPCAVLTVRMPPASA